MRAPVVTLCLVIILWPHSLCKPASGAAIPDHNSPQEAPLQLCDEEEETPGEQLADHEQRRKEVLREEILYKLGYEQPPEDPPNDLMISEEDFASYTAAVALDETIVVGERAQETMDGCKEKETFYAKEVKLFFPSHFYGDLPSVNIFDWDSILIAKRYRRDKDNKDDKDDKDVVIKTDPRLKPATTTAVYEPTSPTPPLPEDLLSAEMKHLSELLAPIRYTLSFNDVHLPTQTEVWSATLQLYKRKIIFDSESVKRTPNPTENIEIYWKSTFIDENGNYISYPVLIKSQDVRTEEDQYISFDVTEGVRRWLSDGLSVPLDFEVVIRCSETVDTGLLYLPTVQFDVPNSSRGKGSKDANLVIKVIAENHKRNSTRTKRLSTVGISREFCLANPEEENCCIKQTTVNFHKDLNFTWILAPKTFQFTYCAGLCPRIWPSGTTNFELRGQLRTMNPTASPEPCCVPHDTSSLTVLLVGEGQNLELHKLTGMVVDSCQCR